MGSDSDITFSPNTGLTFTTTNYHTAQTVTLSAAQDADNTYGTATIIHMASSTDTRYSGRKSTITAKEGDDDVCPSTTAVNSAPSGGLVDDCNTLLAAKAMLSSNLADASNPLYSWDINRPMADGQSVDPWTGIKLNNDSSRVQEVDLSNSESYINGVIPVTLGNLPNLTKLELDGNKLTGSIPAELG